MRGTRRTGPRITGLRRCPARRADGLVLIASACARGCRVQQRNTGWQRRSSGPPLRWASRPAALAAIPAWNRKLGSREPNRRARRRSVALPQGGPRGSTPNREHRRLARSGHVPTRRAPPVRPRVASPWSASTRAVSASGAHLPRSARSLEFDAAGAGCVARPRLCRPRAAPRRGSTNCGLLGARVRRGFARPRRGSPGGYLWRSRRARPALARSHVPGTWPGRSQTRRSPGRAGRASKRSSPSSDCHGGRVSRGFAARGDREAHRFSSRQEVAAKLTLRPPRGRTRRDPA